MNIGKAKQHLLGALWALLALSITISGVALAQTYVFNRFGPSNGILVGDTTTYQTTAATSSDILALWTGTCADTTYLRGDGSCQVPPTGGGGTPGGLNGYVQYNNAGSFSGDAGLTYNDSTDTLNTGALVTGILTSTTSSLGSASSTSLAVSGDADLNTIDSIAVADFARLSQPVQFAQIVRANGISATGLSGPGIELQYDTAGATSRVVSYNRTGGTYLPLSIDAASVVVGDISGTSSINLQATSVQANGSTICRQNGTGCPINLHTGCVIGSSGTITRNLANCASVSKGSTGSYLVSFTTSYNAVPICYGNATGGVIGIVQIAVTNTTSVGVDTRNFSGTLTDMAFTLSCIGNS